MSHNQGIPLSNQTGTIQPQDGNDCVHDRKFFPSYIHARRNGSMNFMQPQNGIDCIQDRQFFFPSCIHVRRNVYGQAVARRHFPNMIDASNHIIPPVWTNKDVHIDLCSAGFGRLKELMPILSRTTCVRERNETRQKGNYFRINKFICRERGSDRGEARDRGGGREGEREREERKGREKGEGERGNGKRRGRD